MNLQVSGYRDTVNLRKILIIVSEHNLKRQQDQQGTSAFRISTKKFRFAVKKDD